MADMDVCPGFETSEAGEAVAGGILALELRTTSFESIVLKRGLENGTELAGSKEEKRKRQYDQDGDQVEERNDSKEN